MAQFFDKIFTSDVEATELAIIAMDNAAEMGKKVDEYLVNWFNQEAEMNGKSVRRDTFLIKNKCPRFTTGDGKGLINETIRGKDIYILCDVGNYSLTYNMFGVPNRMSPDDHYTDLKRLIAAIGRRWTRPPRSVCSPTWTIPPHTPDPGQYAGLSGRQGPPDLSTADRKRLQLPGRVRLRRPALRAPFRNT